MQYIDFHGETISRLGFGTMRLPVHEDKTIDENMTEEMIREAIRNGVNYFDTAYPYHGGMSEIVVGKVLRNYPRDSFYLADKYPGHQKTESYHPEEIFEEQLQKCGVDYFDFYLLHNVCEYDMDVYLDPKWKIIPYFLEQKRKGRIRHLGFSSHGRPENLSSFVNRFGKEMEFCQIQLNYLDWTLQEAEKKVDILNRAGIPIWVMEPVRGGKLAHLPESMENQMRSFRPEDSTASWCFRFLQEIPGVTLILSGMSDINQVRDNIRTFENMEKLTGKEREMLFSFAEELKDAVPCTSCRYCCDGCPAGLDIPVLMHSYNEAKVGGGFTVSMLLEAMPEEKWPSACIGCGACSEVCPQKIDIPEIMKTFTEIQKTLPNWGNVCKERAAAAERARLAGS